MPAIGQTPGDDLENAVHRLGHAFDDAERHRARRRAPRSERTAAADTPFPSPCRSTGSRSRESRRLSAARTIRAGHFALSGWAGLSLIRIERTIDGHKRNGHPSDVLAERTREGDLYHRLDREWVHCYACGHDCKIPPGAVGVCKVRFNEGGRLMVPWGYVGGVQCDPIEKKPFFHVYPGALAYSFGMLGCDLHCGYCQNWVTSQALRDPHAVSPPMDVTPELLVRDALRAGREDRRQHLQRAADHQRMGGRDFQGGARGRA